MYIELFGKKYYVDDQEVIDYIVNLEQIIINAYDMVDSADTEQDVYGDIEISSELQKSLKKLLTIIK